MLTEAQVDFIIIEIRASAQASIEKTEWNIKNRELVDIEDHFLVMVFA